MRLRILSDLHMEFGPRLLPLFPADIVVLAGDIDRGTRGVLWAKRTFPDVPVLYVAGNHEHYDERIGRLHQKLRAAAAVSNVIVLENEVFEFRGIRFFGATMWTDFALLGDTHSAMLAAGSATMGMSDYRKIRREDTGRLRPEDTAMLHANSRLTLQRFLSSGDCSRSVVITHHAPSSRSVPAARASDILSAAYASDMEDLIKEHGPALWIHGHIHDCQDYLIGKTRVLSNPAGYAFPRESEATGFRPDLLIEI